MGGVNASPPPARNFRAVIPARVARRGVYACPPQTSSADDESLSTPHSTRPPDRSRRDVALSVTRVRRDVKAFLTAVSTSPGGWRAGARPGGGPSAGRRGRGPPPPPRCTARG